MSTTKVSAALMESGTKGADISSASSITIGLDGSYMDITGTTTIATMVCDAGRIFTLQFDSAVTLTHSSTLYLAGAVDFATEANDHLTFVAVAANDVRQIGAGLKDGGSPVAAASVTANSFYAYITNLVENETGDGTSYDVLGSIWTEVFDNGNDFVNGTYTAEVSGTYIFGVMWGLGGITSSHTLAYFSLVTSNVTHSLSSHNPYVYAAGVNRRMTTTMLAEMDAGDTAFPKVIVENGSKVIDIFNTPQGGFKFWGGRIE